MLSNLNIKNYALIDNLSINFSDSFTVISGDTGSGKSIILDALSILLGSRVDKKKINTDKCVIEASFKINSDIEYFFNKYDLDFDLAKKKNDMFPGKYFPKSATGNAMSRPRPRWQKGALIDYYF